MANFSPLNPQALEGFHRMARAMAMDYMILTRPGETYKKLLKMTFILDLPIENDDVP